MAVGFAAPDLQRIDQRISLRDVSWEQYEAILAMRGESSALRVTYLKGELEIMAPSMDREGLKKRLARLVEAWAEESDIALEGAGSWTVKRKIDRLGAEADECYFVGEQMRDDHPDIAIEVVWTSGGIDKLEVWRGLRVPEVWIWNAGDLSIYRLEKGHYRHTVRSQLLPSFDPQRIAVHMTTSSSQTQAVRALRAEMSEQVTR